MAPSDSEEDHPEDQSRRSAGILALSLISRVIHWALHSRFPPLFFLPGFLFFLFFSFNRRVVPDRVIETFFCTSFIVSERVCTRDGNRIRGPRRYTACQKVSARNHCTLVRDRSKGFQIASACARSTASRTMSSGLLIGINGQQKMQETTGIVASWDAEKSNAISYFLRSLPNLSYLSPTLYARRAYLDAYDLNENSFDHCRWHMAD